ncbi:hypothetical protein SAMN05444354_108109 [Stigmatella aurantiaca]|uniref:Uncharacterized protein n=1 Tax=Stigmatella aurantiaca TaxID=41 RepID=A0A1H7SSE8_STIAU|nr:hypothetical protein [Stigmatella aurantiaca]SEL75368.1 hypothetical protein SAMN05444354_108109 [Stigmatella aurantiaca]
MSIVSVVAASLYLGLLPLSHAAPIEAFATANSCTAPRGTLFLNGDVGIPGTFNTRDYIHPGADVIINGTWSTHVYSSTSRDYVRIHVTPALSAQGLWWDIAFSTQQLGTPLAVGLYTNAQRAPFADPGHPGLSVSGDGRGCNTLAGEFQIHDIVWDSVGLLKLSASFLQRCEAGTPVLRGMVAYERQ